MSSARADGRNRRPAGQPRSLSPEGKRFTATHPALYLHCWANFEGMNITANVDWLDDQGRLQRVVVAKQTWQPPMPNEVDVVLWAARALSAWLEARIMAMGDAELSAS